MGDFFELYDALIAGVDSCAPVCAARMGRYWTSVEAEGLYGIAMTTPGDTAPRSLPEELTGLTLAQVAAGVKSWNLAEASFSMAAINACYNTPARLEALGAWEPFENYCTDGLDLRGKRIGVVGHMNMPRHVYEEAESVWILERDPRPGDYPDSACDVLLPRCDIVLITASTLVNKTLPHLLQLCADACTVLTGPSCPMCPQLLELGLDRIAGLVVTDRKGMDEKVRGIIPGHPYTMGKPFLLKRESR